MGDGPKHDSVLLNMFYATIMGSYANTSGTIPNV